MPNPAEFSAMPEPALLMFLLMGLFLLVVVLGALFFKLLLWEEQFNAGREAWLQEIRNSARTLKTIQRQSRKIATNAESLPFAGEPLMGWKTLGVLLKFLKVAGPLRYARFFF
jgi:hypothetical protein